MRFASRYFVLVCMLFFATGNSVQAQVAKPVQPLAQKQTLPRLHLPYSGFLSGVKDTTAIAKNYLPLNFYTTHLGAACKVELQLEKQTKLPLRIRLGSKDQVDYLEGKFNRN